MAQITFKANHSNHRVLLDDQDRQLLAAAIKAKQDSGVTSSQIAADLGIGRTYLYALASNNFIELTRFALIQRYFNLYLLSQEQVETYLKELRQLLLPETEMVSLASPSPGLRDLVATVQKPLNLSSWRDY